MKTCVQIIASTCACCLILIFSGCENDGLNHNFGNNDPNLILALGDSITAGYGVSGAEAYPSQLARMTGQNVINAGVNGALSWDAPPRFESYITQYNPGYVLILYGANNVTYRSTEDTPETLLAIALRAKELRMIPVMATLPTAYRDADHATETGLLNERIRALARSNNIRLADLERDFGDNRALVSSDGLHPTAEGMRIIAISFMTAMQSRVGGRPGRK